MCGHFGGIETIIDILETIMDILETNGFKQTTINYKPFYLIDAHHYISNTVRPVQLRASVGRQKVMATSGLE